MESSEATLDTNWTPAHVVFKHLCALLQDTRADGDALTNLKSDMAYMAPELEDRRWNKMWEFILNEVIPYDKEDWTQPIRHYWQAVVPSVSKTTNPPEQAASE